ncbi:MAG TPA: hypothetical protein VIU44_01805, partial [Gaiellaceae bacterium]
MTAVAAAAVRAVSLPWRDLLVLLKLRIASLIVLVALAAAVAAGETDARRLLVLALAAGAALFLLAGALTYVLVYTWWL